MVDPYGKALPIDGDLTHFGAKFNVGQAAGGPLQVSIEFLAADIAAEVDKAVEPLVGAKECQKRVLTRGIDQCHEVFQERDLNRGLRKEQAGVPLEVRAPLEEAGVEPRRGDECSQTEVEGACTHPDRVQHDIRAHSCSAQL